MSYSSLILRGLDGTWLPFFSSRGKDEANCWQKCVDWLGMADLVVADRVGLRKRELGLRALGDIFLSFS